MYKSFLILVFLVLFGPYSDHVAGQATSDKSQPQTNIENAKNPIPKEREAEAKELYREGMKLTEAGQFSQAVENLQQALRLDPEYADAYAALGRAYFKMRLWQKAIVNLRRAAELRTKQRASQDPLYRNVLMQESKGASTQVKAVPTSPQIKQEANANAAAVKPLESETTRQPEQTADGVPALKSNDDTASKQEREPVGVRVAMSVTPASRPVETKSVSPISTAASSDEVSLAKIYRVGPSDVLDIRVNDSQSTQSTLFTVTPSGLLEHPTLTEPLPVTGFTVEEIGTKIENDLKKRAMIDDPKVVVGVRDYASHTILVSGLVKESGTKFLRREAIPLYVVLADAQPLPEAATVTIVRNELNQKYEIDLTETADMNLLVRPGDVITLHPNVTQFVYIGGEVKFPGEKTFRRGLTLMQAIIVAGGATSKSKVAEIGRDNGRGFLIATRINLKEVVSGKTADPLLRPGDRIMVLR